MGETPPGNDLEARIRVNEDSVPLPRVKTWQNRVKSDSAHKMGRVAKKISKKYAFWRKKFFFHVFADFCGLTPTQPRGGPGLGEKTGEKSFFLFWPKNFLDA